MRFPSDLKSELLRKEWEKSSAFRGHLLRARAPIDLPLHPPSGPEALADLSEFVRFMKEWEAIAMAHPGWVQLETRKLQTLDQRRVPVRLRLPSVVDLAEFIGAGATTRLRRVMSILSTFEAIDADLKSVVIMNIIRFEKFTDIGIAQFALALRQLKPGMGQGVYLRSLRLDGVDTKFIERNLLLVEAMMDGWLDSEVMEAGGLLNWLGCLTKGADRLVLRPLCETTRAAFGGVSRLWLESDELATAAMPGKLLLVVENEIAALELPDIPDCIAVGGCGGNLAWMAAEWVQRRPVGYWGDIDTWGLIWLASATRKASHLFPLMMDLATLEAHRSSVVTEPDPCEVQEKLLDSERVRLREALKSGVLAPVRLEQEKLSKDWITRALQNWVDTSQSGP